jgi:glycosyltransferase involved in cell wall biosynthesis
MAKEIIIPDIPSIVPGNHKPAIKMQGFARFIFLGRICKMKNLLFAIQALSRTKNVALEIYGPIEDHRYWKECESEITLNSLAAFHYGELPHERVLPTLQRGHFFILPTLGENFCHALFEALAAGCTPLISNKTSWHDLMEKEAGWTLPLTQPDMWDRTISRCIDMNQDEYSDCSIGAHRYAMSWVKRQDFATRYSAMFNTELV